ncbi:MAG: complex I NDUFA9 subunit family protein [Alphaproteobacteria bacterium]
MTTKLVTIFGGGGFLGRHLVRLLAQQGHSIRVAVRDPESALFLKPMGDVGQITPIQANIRSDASVAAAVAGSDAVVNLVGILYESGSQSFDAVHKTGAATVAKAAANAGAERFVHMSALGASEQSAAKYARSKARGETAVTEAFPGVSIMRPSVVFGPQDDFFNRFANLARFSPVLPLIGGGHTKFQPVYVVDVAEAMAACVNGRAENAQGQVYELGGPTVYTFEELMRLVMHYTGYDRRLVSIPFGLARLQGMVLGLLPTPPLTADQVDLLKSDNVVTGDLPGLADFGIHPTAAEVILPTYMDVHRRGGRYSQTAVL